MPWSNQGGGNGGGWQGGGGQGPWGRGPGGPQAPDLGDLLRKGQERFKRFLPGGSGGFRGFAIVIAVIAVIWAASGFYRVQPDEQGVELIFGRWIATTEPGLRYNFPIPIGEVHTPKVTRINRVELGFRSAGDAARPASVRQVPGESLMLTGDENIVDINFVVFWVISDAGKFLFNIRDPERTVKDAAEAAMREVIGKTEIASALAEGRSEVERQTRELLQVMLDHYETGISVTQVQLQKVDPPGAVIDAFRDVQAARADLERLRNEAEAYRNDVIPRARGEAEQLTQEAEAYRQEVVARAEGDAERFVSVYNAYKVAKDVTIKRIYLETMEEILTGMTKVVIDSTGGGTQGVLPYLPLPELQKQQQASGTR